MRQTYTILFIVTVFGAVSFLSTVAHAQSLFDLVNLKDQNLADITAYEKIDIVSAWNFLEENPPSLTPVTIGIFDTGIDRTHPEFDDVPIITSSSIDHEEGGHGTQVAGIIGANNISFDSPYIPKHMNGILSGVRDLDYTLQVRFDSALAGFNLQDGFRHFVILDELARSPDGIDVVNYSFGAPLCSELTIAQRIIRKTLDLDCYDSSEFNTYKIIYSDLVSQYPNILFVFGVGNENIDAEFNLPGGGVSAANTIAVAATDLNDERSIIDFQAASNFGLLIDVAAPGEEIYAPKPLKGAQLRYDLDFNGTSASAPMVTGVAGLIKAIKPNLMPKQIRDILIETADPLFVDDTNIDEIEKTLGSNCFNGTPPTGKVFRGCRLNALAAVKAVLAPTTTQCSDGVDNDGDGLIDLSDPGCSDANDDDESDVPPLPGIGNEVLIYAGNGSFSGQVGLFGVFTTVAARYNAASFPVTNTDIFPSDLSSFRLIFLVAPGSEDDSGPNFFTPTQVSLLNDFLDQGGRLVVLGDHSGLFGVNTVNNLLTQLGVNIIQNSDMATTDNDLDPPLTDITPIPLTLGVNSIDFSAASSLTVGINATSIIRIQTGLPNAGATVAALQEVNNGEVLVIGDTQGFDDATFADFAGDGIGDALQFVDNLVNVPPPPTSLIIRGTFSGTVTEIDEFNATVPGGIQVGDIIATSFSYDIIDAVATPVGSEFVLYSFPSGRPNSALDITIKGLTWSSGPNISASVLDNDPTSGDLFAISGGVGTQFAFPGALGNGLDRMGLLFSIFGVSNSVFDLLNSTDLPTSLNDLNFSSVEALGCCFGGQISSVVIVNDLIDKSWRINYEIDLDSFVLNPD